MIEHGSMVGVAATAASVFGWGTGLPRCGGDSSIGSSIGGTLLRTMPPRIRNITGTPEEAGVSIAMIKYAAKNKIPLFGVCLGHQAIGVAFGAKVSRAPELLHGKTSVVHHNGHGVLADIPDPFTATRYHSLAIESASVPDELEVVGSTDSGVIMAIQHKTLPISGVQFHPESVLTEYGHQMLGNWLVACGDLDARKRSAGLSPVVARN